MQKLKQIKHGVLRCVCVVSLGLANVSAAWAQEIAGIWWTPGHDGKVEVLIDPTEGLIGRVFAVGPKGAGDLDSRNPDPKLRQRRVLGTVVFSGFKQEAKNKWVEGKVYDPQLGATYDAKIWLEDANTLMLRGYIGFSLFGRSETFKRVLGATPRVRQADEPELVYAEGR